MTTDRTAVAPAPAGGAATGPAVGRRRLAVAAAVVLLLAVAGALLVRLTPLAGRLGLAPSCTVLAGERDVRPPAAVTDAAARVRDRVAGSVSTVTTTCSLTDQSLPGPGEQDPADDPARWVVGVDAQAADVDTVSAAAAALLAAAQPTAPSPWRLEVHDAARSLTVVLTPGSGLVQDAVALRRVPGVVEVSFAPDGGRIAVATGADVAALLDATAGRDLPVTTVETRDDWLEVHQVHPGTWPDGDAVALAVDVSGWEGVWRVVLRGGAPASPDLTVEADDEVRRAQVATRLDAAVYPGPPLGYHVLAQQVAVDGVVGVPVGLPVDPAAAGDPAAVDGAPACTGDELRVEVTGTDAALGTRFLQLRATHTGSTPCVLSGLPALAFTRQSGTPTPDVTQLPDLVAPDAPPTVVLAPGDAVASRVRWAAMSTSQDRDVAVSVAVRAVAAGPAVELALPDPLDVLAGATVKVGPWTAEAG